MIAMASTLSALGSRPAQQPRSGRRTLSRRSWSPYDADPRPHARMSSDDAAARVGRVFEEIAEDYDQTGVEFFAPISLGMVDLLELDEAERVVDVGCGRCALTF